jgi:organic radical activating enzyme
MLETNGTLATAFTALTCPPDYIAMDIKLPTTTGLHPCWEEHAAFLNTVCERIGRQVETLRNRLQVKLVFSENCQADIAQAAELIANCNPAIPCILQPVTPHPGGPLTPGVSSVLEAQQIAAHLLRDVRVIPQTHVILGQW